MAEQNIHGTAILLGDRGVLVTGASGSGKTTLALALVDRARSVGALALLVSDDRLLVCARHGRLVCRAPAAIAGLAEVYGIGPRAFPFQPAAVVDLCVTLVPAASAPRYQEGAPLMLAGVSVPGLELAERNFRAAAAAVGSWLRASA